MSLYRVSRPQWIKLLNKDGPLLWNQKNPITNTKMPHFVVAISTNLVHVTLQRDQHTGCTTVRVLIFSTIYKINIGNTVTCWATDCCVMWLDPTRSMNLYRKCMSPCIYCLDYSLTWLNLKHTCQKRDMKSSILFKFCRVARRPWECWNTRPITHHGSFAGATPTGRWWYATLRISCRVWWFHGGIWSG